MTNNTVSCPDEERVAFVKERVRFDCVIAVLPSQESMRAPFKPCDVPPMTERNKPVGWEEVEWEEERKRPGQSMLLV
jgi:hypothetical protein